MINRIRDVRRAKGMTLDAVAQRCDPLTTAQTIGRLETGTRTLSLDWLNRIAAALGVEPRELVRDGAASRIEVAAELGADGARALSRRETADPPQPGERMIALRVTAGQGDYRAGDMVWLNQIDPEAFAAALNRDVLVPRPGGRFAFGRLIAREEGRMQILPPGPGQRQLVVPDAPWLGLAATLIRTL